MSDQIFLVALEKLQGLNLSKVLPDACIKILVDRSQAKLPKWHVKQAQAPGSRVALVPIDGNIKNALDFHIACFVPESEY